MSNYQTELKSQIDDVIARGIKEDGLVSTHGDVTTNGTVGHSVQATGRFLAKANGVLSGLQVAERVFAMVDPELRVQWTMNNGDYVSKGTYFGTVTGKAHSLIRAERLSLNLMQRMSGVASLTRKMVDAVKGTHTKILDTRKTVPGLRFLDKLAVSHGGGTNHRIGLHDMVMIKDNHVTASGGVVNAIRAVKKHLAAHPERANIPIEVETRTLEEVKLVLQEGGVERIMLDNMVVRRADGSIDTSMLQQALSMIDGQVDTEASGNVTMDTVAEIARCGVTHISSGALTHSVPALDISLKIKLQSAL